MSTLVDPDFIIQKIRIQYSETDSTCQKHVSFLPVNTNEYTLSLTPMPQQPPPSPPFYIPTNQKQVNKTLNLSNERIMARPRSNDFVQVQNESITISKDGQILEILPTDKEEIPETIPEETIVDDGVDEDDVRNVLVPQPISEEEELMFNRETNQVVPPGRSVLGDLFSGKKQVKNPFAEEFSCFSGKGDDGGAINVTIWTLFEETGTGNKPMNICVKKTVSVEEVIGYILYQYVEEGRSPLPSTNLTVYSLRIVEDDGTLDDDFPALDRTRKLSKFSFDQFALCVDQMVLKKTEELVESDSKGFYIRVHVYSTLDVKQTTTIKVQDAMKLAEVLQIVCKKRKVRPEDYTLKMPDGKTDADLNSTIQQSNVRELYMVKKDRGDSAGDVFLRADDAQSNEEMIMDGPAYINANEYASFYKQFVVTRRSAMFGARPERIIAIDGEYIHIMAAENKNFFDQVKTVSYHASDILYCKATKKNSAWFRLACQTKETRVYDFEAQNVNDCNDICNRITFLVGLKK